mgnify:CR=1 FL=1|jgi:hypothetical protein
MSNNQGNSKYRIHYNVNNQLGGKGEKKPKKETSSKSSADGDFIADIAFIWKYRIENEKDLVRGKETDNKIFKKYEDAEKWVNKKEQQDKLMKQYLKELSDIKKSGKTIVFHISHFNIRIQKDNGKPTNIMEVSELSDTVSETSDSDIM